MGKLLKIAIGVGILGVIGTCAGPHLVRETLTAKVTDKEVKRYGEDDSKYLIFTDKETFENTDSLLEWKFNSSDVYGKIEKDQTYEFTVYGFRIPVLSIYRNVVDVKPVVVDQE